MGKRRKGQDLQSRKVKTEKKVTGRSHTTNVNQGSESSGNTGMECGKRGCITRTQTSVLSDTAQNQASHLPSKDHTKDHHDLVAHNNPYCKGYEKPHVLFYNFKNKCRGSTVSLRITGHPEPNVRQVFATKRTACLPS